MAQVCCYLELRMVCTMLLNIDPVLGPDLLSVLRMMGHGDTIVIADANFPSYSMGSQVIRVDGVDATRMLQAILSLMPLDTYVEQPVRTMQVVGQPNEVPPAVAALRSVVAECGYADVSCGTLEREDFYASAKDAFAIVVTSERRLYGNVMLVKGVVPE